MAFFLSFLLFFFLPSPLFSIQEKFAVREMPSIEMEMNRTQIVPLSPYIVSPEGFTIQISGERFVFATFNAKENYITLTPQRDWLGLQALNLNIVPLLSQKSPQGKSSVPVELTLIVKVQKKSGTPFTFKPETPVKEVYVAGDFNGWNPKASKMDGPDANGVFSVTLPLSGGRYGYKFVADGQWFSDPKNPNKVPDGFQGFNSILELKSEGRPEIFGIAKKVQWDPAVKKGKLHAVFGYKSSDENGPAINPDSIFILFDGKSVPQEFFQWSATSQTITLDLKNLPPGTHSIRVLAADRNSIATNELSFTETIGDGAAPFDWRNAVIYSIVTDRFFDGDLTNDRPVPDDQVPWSLNYQGGDWEGIIQKIKSGYFSDLGVNALWISPVVDNPDVAFASRFAEKKVTGYHGYWPISLTQPEEHFGTMQKLKELISVAHKNNLKVMLDAVLNHVHQDHPLFKEKPQWFSSLTLPDGRKNLRLFDERPLDTWFDEFLPDIDYDSNPDAVDGMVDNTLWWIDQTQADGLRLDAVKHMPHVFWKALRKAVNQKIEIPQGRTFYMVGETISPREMILKYIGDDELHGQFDFPLYWTIRDVFAWENTDFERLDSEREKYEHDYGRAIPSIIIGNHDMVRFASMADGGISPQNQGQAQKIALTTPPIAVNDLLSYKKSGLAFSFLLSEPGAPTIYYGDEIGMAGAADPDNRRMMRFEPNLIPAERDLRALVKQLIAIRKRNPALRFGSHKNLLLKKELYVYEKDFFENHVVVGLNRGVAAEPIEFGLPGVQRWKNLLDGTVLAADDRGKAHFLIKGHESAFFSPM